MDCLELSAGTSGIQPAAYSLIVPDQQEYIRGVVVSRKVLADTTPEGVAMNAPRKPRGNAWDKFRTYRLDRVVVELTE